MKTLKYHLYCIACLLIVGYCTKVSALEPLKHIEVFTNSEGAITQIIEQSKRQRPYKLTLHNMNSVEQWEKEFSEGLPGTEELARSEIERRIEKMGGQSVFDAQVMEAYSPLVRAVEIGLLEFPSVVINGSYVVYGTDSVTTAIERFETWIKINEGR